VSTRRHFIYLVPATAAVLLAACKDSSDMAPSAPTTPLPEPAPSTTPPPASTGASDTGSPAAEAAGPMLDDKDLAAVALGYVSDTTRADKAKYPQHAPDQVCSGCTQYQGAAGAEAGPCKIFPGKQVAAKGWCVSYLKKPG
jgi:hypothetical protein